MAAERGQKIAKTVWQNERGQSVLEFLLALPLLVILTMLLIRVDTVMQMSIVDQKWAREQTLFISGNAANYPDRQPIVQEMAMNGGNNMIIGVSEENVGNDDSESSLVAASKYYIGWQPGMGTEQAGDVSQRADVRVRNTVTLCTPLVSFGPNAPAIPIPGNGSLGQYHLPETASSWQFCSSTQQQYD